MTESIFIQVGQCGNQMGYRFWDLALKEHLEYQQNELDHSSFFRPTDDKHQDSKTNGSSSVKARALFVDMEKGVIREILKGPLQGIFDTNQILTDVSGSGNNWAVGYGVYGKAYKDNLEDLIRKESEMCDSLQCFFLLHSIGGGTGSGLGTFLLELLCHEYPKQYRFATSIYPSDCDDVVTSPYNALLSNNQLIEYADCVLPVENKALTGICDYVSKRALCTRSPKISFGPASKAFKEKPFDQMNDIVANLLLNVTCSSRFSGSLNVDLNELVVNMVPYPRLHFLTSSITPLFSVQRCGSILNSTNDLLTDLLSDHHSLFMNDFRQGTFLACALLVRGEVNFSDLQKNIDKWQNTLKFASWIENGWKTGLCHTKPIDNPFSAVLLSNNVSIWQSFASLKTRFLKMYRKKAHLHHFLQVEDFELCNFDSSVENLNHLISEYKHIVSAGSLSKEKQRRFDLLV